MDPITIITSLATQEIVKSAMTGAGSFLGSLVSRNATLTVQARNEQWQRIENEAKRAADIKLFEMKSHQEREMFLAKVEHDFKLQAYLTEINRLKTTYPFLKGPGHIRRTLQLTIPGFPDSPMDRPLVFIEPVADESGDKMWVNARYQAEGILSEFHNKSRIFILTPDQVFGWPDPDLYAHDLIGIPTIVIYGKAGIDRLDVWLGGCHLLPSTPDSPDIGGIPPSRHVMTFRYEHWHEQGEAEVDGVSLAKREGSPLEVRLGGTGNQTLTKKEEERARRLAHRRMIDLASEAMAAIVVVLTDAFYLMRQDNYDQQIDGFLSERSIKLDAINLPKLPLKLVKDPGYYLLHAAERLSMTRPEEAGRMMLEALKIRLGRSSDDETTINLEGIAQEIDGMFRQGHVPDELVLFLRKAILVARRLSESDRFRLSLLPPLQRLSDHRLLPFDESGSRG